MKKGEAVEILNMKTIAYYSGWSGIEIKDIIDDYVVCVSKAFTSIGKPHILKIHYETDRPYFVVDGKRIHLDECIRNS